MTKPQTITKKDADTDQLIIDMGFAPFKPAEFGTLKIDKWSSGSEVEQV